MNKHTVGVVIRFTDANCQCGNGKPATVSIFVFGGEVVEKICTECAHKRLTSEKN